MPRPITYPNIFGTLSGTVSASLLDQNWQTTISAINDSAAGWMNFGIDTGSTNAVVVTLNPPPSGYEPGFAMMLQPLNFNTGPASINVNGLGNVQILKSDGSALTPQILIPGSVIPIVFGTSNFRITSSSPLVGEIQMFGGNTPPANWLICNGQAVSRTTYSALFALVQGTYGVGNGSTTFNVPNFSGRFPTYGTAGAVGGSNTTSITTANLPAHNHPASASVSVSLNDPGHSHVYTNAVFSAPGTSVQGGNTFQASSANVNPSLTGITVSGASASVSIGNTGSGAALATTPAYLAVNFIIRAY